MSEENNPRIKTGEVTLLPTGKNALDVYCQVPNCNSLIFRADTAPLCKSEQILPLGEKVEKVFYFWRLDDMFQFENVTFTKEAETNKGKIKYLGCCDCEFGPIGFQDLQSKICYVAPNRVRYEEPETNDSGDQES